MPLPAAVYDPPFDVTRASHVELAVRDLSASRDFYTEVMGLVVSDENSERVWLRGLEEAAHHSLVLARAPRPSVHHIGFRVQTEADLDAARHYFSARGIPTEFVEVEHQQRTLRISDVTGARVDFCASMEVRPRLLLEHGRFRGGCGHRLDHFQLFTPDVLKATEFYAGFGFRISEYIPAEPEGLVATFLHRKGNPADIVFIQGPGPCFHHVAYTTPTIENLFNACDAMARLGYGRRVERGPGRHGPAFGLFVYFRDPDGHRAELFNAHYLVKDVENEPLAWSGADIDGVEWGLPPQARWFHEASAFTGTAIDAPPLGRGPMTLEKYLSDHPFVVE